MRRFLIGIGTVALVALTTTPAYALRGIAPSAGVVAGERSGPVAPSLARCDEGHWPATVEGEPQRFDPGDRAGYRVWHDGSGWHLRTTTPNTGDHVFVGRIRSADDVKIVAEYHDEARDKVRIDGKVISFELHTHNRIDGLDFVVGCTDHVSFSLQADAPGQTRSSPVPADRIWLGRQGRAPGNPFRVFRVK